MRRARRVCRPAAQQISRDEWGFPIVSPAPASDPDLRRTVAACPALALRLVADR